MAGLVPAIHVFDAFNRRLEGYQPEKALFLEGFASGEANVKLVIGDGAAWMAGTSPAMTVEGSETQPERGLANSYRYKSPIWLAEIEKSML